MDHKILSTSSHIEFIGLSICIKEGIPESGKRVKEDMMWQTGFGQGMLKRDLSEDLVQWKVVRQGKNQNGHNDDVVMW